MKNQRFWEVSADYNSEGERRVVKLRINPKTGKVLRILKPEGSQDREGGS